jgi:hypothetical protein
MALPPQSNTIEGATIRIVFILGEAMIESSDSQGEGLRKILYQAYHMLKKVKSVNMLTCRHFEICHVFPPEKISTDKQTDNQLICKCWDTLLKSYM